jgi:phosphatidylserine decarboxylase
MSDANVPAVSPDLPSSAWRVTLAALRRLPQGALSRSFGKLADTPIPRPMRRLVLGSFARTLGIDVSQAERPITDYRSLNEFFVRRLKPGARTWPSGATTAGSPVEAIVGQCGSMSAGTLLQAKGRWYSGRMLLDDEEEARHFERGSYVTLYLSPRHYHRIHTPIAGAITKARHIPGQLLPVNAPSVAHVPNLFAINERIVCYLDSPIGRVAVVAIGAYNVGRISAAFDTAWSAEAWVTNRKAARAETRTYAPPVTVRAGEEIMAFHLGSTVVVLFASDRLKLSKTLEPGEEVLLGAPIATPL